MESFGTSKVVKAAKDHLCDGCQKTIKKGTVHNIWRGKYDGEWGETRHHQRCLDLMRKVEKRIGDQDYWVPVFELESYYEDSLSDDEREEARKIMSGYLSDIYHVRLVNYLEEFDAPQETHFTASDPEHVKTLISAYCAFYSGDPYKCFINGEEAVLDRDFGLLSGRSPKGGE